LFGLGVRILHFIAFHPDQVGSGGAQRLFSLPVSCFLAFLSFFRSFCSFCSFCSFFSWDGPLHSSSGVVGLSVTMLTLVAFACHVDRSLSKVLARFRMQHALTVTPSSPLLFPPCRAVCLWIMIMASIHPSIRPSSRRRAFLWMGAAARSPCASSCEFQRHLPLCNLGFARLLLVCRFTYRPHWAYKTRKRCSSRLPVHSTVQYATIQCLHVTRLEGRVLPARPLSSSNSNEKLFIVGLCSAPIRLVLPGGWHTV